MTLSPFIIDCDTGRDDALALSCAISLNLPLVGVVASYGNTNLSNVIDNTARILAFAGREDIPLFAGASEPSQPHKSIEKILAPRQQSAGNGLCNIVLPEATRGLPQPLEPAALAQEIVKLAEKHGPLDYVILGPATNFAALCKVLGKDVQKTIKRVIMMGGKFDDLWHKIPGADFNLVCDPYAVRNIMRAGYHIHFVPMNATHPIFLTAGELGTIKTSTPLSEQIKKIMVSHVKNFATEKFFRFHDPVVMLALMNPEHFQPVKMDIICDDKLPDFGRLFRPQGGFSAQVYETDVRRQKQFLKTLLETLGLSL